MNMPQWGLCVCVAGGGVGGRGALFFLFHTSHSTNISFIESHLIKRTMMALSFMYSSQYKGMFIGKGTEG